MKLKIFEQNKKKEEEVFLKLVPSPSSGGISLAVVDEFGHVKQAGYVLTITSDGELLRHGCLDSKFGLKLDSGSFIKMIV